MAGDIPRAEGVAKFGILADSSDDFSRLSDISAGVVRAFGIQILGFYLVTGVATKDLRNRVFGLVGMYEETLLRKATMVGTTFVLTCIGWIIFRARTMADAWYVMTHFTSGWDFGRIGTEQFLLRQLPAAALGILVLEIGQLLQGKISIPAVLGRLPMTPRWALYASFVMAVLMFGIYRKTQFIYFQF